MKLEEDRLRKLLFFSWTGVVVVVNFGSLSARLWSPWTVDCFFFLLPEQAGRTKGKGGRK